MENYQHLIFEDLKAVDADRAFLSLFAPDECRFAVQVIDLWNAEIARIRDEVREPHMGIIRLQWWHDEIRKICAGVPSDAHPVLMHLSDVISQYELPFELFQQALTGRQFEFEDRAAESVAELAAYALRVHAPVLQLKAKVLSVEEPLDDFARDYALIGVLRSVPFHGAQGRHIIPHTDDVKKVVRDICELVSCANPADRYFKASCALMCLYKKQIEKAGYDPLALRPLPFKELRVWLKSF